MNAAAAVAGDISTYADALRDGRAVLAAAGVDTAALDARLLLAAAAGIDMATLIATGSEPLPAHADAQFRRSIERRVAGEPVARILGVKEFWGLPFRLNAATLVPRPETETLVEAVLGAAPGFPPDLTICDLGTGSGAILVALLTELPGARGTGIDLSAEALVAARENSAAHGIAARAAFREGSFADAAGAFHVVVSNPPYIESSAISGLAAEVRDHDPRLALDGGADGLDAYRVIAGRAPHLLLPGGLLAVEVGMGQAAAVAELFRGAGLDAVATRHDLSGIERVVMARRPAAR